MVPQPQALVRALPRITIAGTMFPMNEKAPPRYKFPRPMRLKGRIPFSHAYHAGKRRTVHPLTVHALRREDNGPPKIGISIGRRCGHAVQRNLIKRRLREAFRLLQHELPVGFDFVVVVKPHQPLELAAYQSRLRQLMH